LGRGKQDGKHVLRAAVARFCWARTLQWILIWY
jgi:hypothetical protein